MKAFSKLSLNIVLIGLMGGAAQAAPLMAQTKFWQTPQLAQHHIGFLQSVNAPTCVAFDQTIEPVKKYLTATYYDRLRNLPLEQSNELSFQVTLGLDNIGAKADLQTQIDAANRELLKGGPDTLPYYTQPLAEVIVEFGQKLAIEVSKDSRTEFAKSLGLASSSVRIDAQGVKVFGKDLLCDFLDGKAQIKMFGQATSKISLENQLKLMRFYKEIEEKTNRAYSLKNSVVPRTALLTFGFYGVLTENSFATELLEPLTLELIDRLFTEDTLARTDYWSKSIADEEILDVKGSSKPYQIEILIGNEGY